ncbi:DUF481 domain-containing protein [Lewinella sp. LCG006]|uniref:DUF481 domain-containing protein n=1 Tax=Lewinella sp. LCG006 TaxID=3231911 RepID=UPI00346030DF
MRFTEVRNIILAFALLGSITTNGQIVNIEDKRANLDTVGWFWQLDFGGKLTENTRSVLALNGAIRVDQIKDHSQWLFLVNYNLVKADEDRFVNDGFGHLRFGQQINERWTWETFGQLQYNRRLLIDFRALAGTGPRLQIREQENWELALGLLYMFEYNELEEGEITRNDNRLSSYLSARVKVGQHASFASTSYYQPLVSRLGESRLSSVNTISISLNERIAFGSSFSITYDGLLAQLLPDIPATSYIWNNTLRLRF